MLSKYLIKAATKLPEYSYNVAIIFLITEHYSTFQANKLCDMYREQCLTLEEELCKLKEENDISRSMFKERTSQMTKRLTTVNSRFGFWFWYW